MELVLIGVGLSMDAFAVALCKGLSMRRVNYAHAAVIALFFGVFQAVMPPDRLGAGHAVRALHHVGRSLDRLCLTRLYRRQDDLGRAA